MMECRFDSRNVGFKSYITRLKPVYNQFTQNFDVGKMVTCITAIFIVQYEKFSTNTT